MLTIAEKIVVMQASEAGSDIQCQHIGNENALWRESPKPSWNWYEFTYRVKAAPAYRRFSKSEFNGLMGRIISPPGSSLRYCIVTTSSIGGWVCIIKDGGCVSVPGSVLLREYEFVNEDGTTSPCGVLVD